MQALRAILIIVAISLVLLGNGNLSSAQTFDGKTLKLFFMMLTWEEEKLKIIKALLKYDTKYKNIKKCEFPKKA